MLNRAGRRKANKTVKKKLTEEQFIRLQEEADKEYIEREIQSRCDFVRDMFTKALDKALKENGISSIKIMKILNDIEVDLIRMKGDQDNGKS